MFALSIITVVAIAYGFVSYSQSSRMAPRAQVAGAAVIPAGCAAIAIPLTSAGFTLSFYAGPLEVPLLAVAAVAAGMIISQRRMAIIIDKSAAGQ